MSVLFDPFYHYETTRPGNLCSTANTPSLKEVAQTMRRLKEQVAAADARFNAKAKINPCPQCGHLAVADGDAVTVCEHVYDQLLRESAKHPAPPDHAGAFGFDRLLGLEIHVAPRVKRGDQ